MIDSPYLHRALYHEQNPLGTRLFRSRLASIFVQPESQASRVEAYSPGSVGSFAKHSSRADDNGGQSLFKPSFQAADVPASDFGAVELIALRSVEDVRNYVENAGMFRAF